MSLHVLADHMASKGRNGDTMLVHMTPGEVAGLQALAMKHGGSLTINPETGLHEASFLKSLLPMLAGFALGPAGFGLVSSGLAAGAVVGGVTGLATGSLSKGLMAGLGAYGGFGLGEALTSAGAGALEAGAASAAQGQLGAANLALGEALPEEAAKQFTQDAATRQMAAATPFDKLSAGFNAATSSPSTMGQFAKDNWKYLAAAASPILADQMVPTTTKAASPTDTGNIRKFSYDPYSQRYTPQGVFPAAGYKGGMADGGIVALADGGSLTPEQIRALATPTTTAEQFSQATAGYNPQDVNTALQGSGLSGAAQYALTHKDIGDVANTAENYGGISGLSNNINYWLGQHQGASANDINAEMKKWDLTDEDFQRATGKSVTDYATGPLTKVEQPIGGTGGNLSATVNPNGTISQTALAPNVTGGQPTGTVDDIKKIYTQGGGSLGYTPVAPKTMAEFNQRFNTMNPEGDSAAAYNYLMGKGAYPTKSNVGEIMKPYSEAVLGVPQDLSTRKYLYDAKTRKMVLNPDYVPMSYDTKGVQSFGLSTNDVKKYLNANNTATDSAVYDWAVANNVNPDQIAAALNANPELIRAKWNAVKGTTGGTTGTVSADGTKVNVGGTDYSLYNQSVKPPGNWKWDNGGDMTPGMWVKADVAMAEGGITGNGQLNLNIPLNLGGGGGGGYSGGYSAAGSGGNAGFGSLPPEFAAKLGAGISNNVAQSGLPDFRSQLQGLDAKIQQLPSVMAYNDYGKSISGRAPTADETAQMNSLRNAIAGDKGYTDLQSQMQSLGNKYQQQAMGTQSTGLQQRYMQQAPNVSSFAEGGYAMGGLGNLGGYSDGGRLLKGPGDGVSDSIPATIGAKGQPARLADGEFVVPARIVSELGNGSTDAGAKKLYAMMDRVQRARGKTTGKNKVAANSRADKYLPA